MSKEAQHERLSVLSEECGEVVQAISKVVRHGIDGKWKENPSNREHLEIELGDLFHSIDVLIENGDVDPTKIEHYKRLKRSRIKPYLYFEENKI